jgi:hypothetical protein
VWPPEFSRAIGNRFVSGTEAKHGGDQDGVVGRGGRMVDASAEIAGERGCALAGCASRSGNVNQDIGELAGAGRLGISVGDNAG